MLPSVAPTVLLFARVHRGARRRCCSCSATSLVWTLYGLAAYAVYRAMQGGRAVVPRLGRSAARGSPAAALVAAGLYQLTPLKSACLRHCRSPLHFLLRGRAGWRGALVMGVEHGAVLRRLLPRADARAVRARRDEPRLDGGRRASSILVEKTLPGGEAFARVIAIVLVGLGLWVALSPGSVAGADPAGRGMPMQAQMR